MAKKLEVYKCDVCGNVVEVLTAGFGLMVCCNKAMTLLTENITDAAKEKHVPVIEELDEGYKVSVGSVLHPMEEKHYIEWIELLVDSKVYRQFLKPGERPEAVFYVKGTKISAREYCNLHGLWKA